MRVESIENALELRRPNVGRAFRGELPGVISSGGDGQEESDFISAFENAKRTIRILESASSRELFDNAEALETAARFLRRGGEIELLIELTSSQAEEFVEKLYVVEGGRLEVKCVPRHVVQDHEYNLMIVDETAYRFQEKRLPGPMPVIASGRENQRRLQVLLNAFERIKILSSPWLPLARGTPRVEPALEAS